ncbi:MAG: CoA transferase [Bacteroidetes bacterium]|nr:CoA transferase [Bacteroidota bacterium]
MFKDLRVIELAGVLAGPSVGLFFAELGAEVIKIENPATHGDVTRSWKLRTEDGDSDTSAYYWSVNFGKTVHFLNFSLAADLEVFYELVKGADIVISNYKLGDDQKLKVSDDILRKLNPGLIYASINGFGKDSPRTAYDLVLQAESGFMYMNGEAGSPPVKLPVALIDILAGHQLKEAILIALLHRAKTGLGARLSVSLFDSAVASLANQATNWLIAHHLPEAQGSLHPNIAPYGELFQTRDHQLITFAIGSNKQFVHLCRLAGMPELANDPSFSENQQRVIHRTELYDKLKQAIAGISFTEIYEACLKLDIPIGKIRNMKDVFELGEARAMLRSFSYNNKAYQAVSSIAFKFES